MSSGGWEVVGKNKKDKSGSKTGKPSKAERQKFVDNAPKVEDFLPLSQVKTYYDNLQSNNKENKKSSPKGKDNKPKENDEKKKQKNEKKKEDKSKSNNSTPQPTKVPHSIQDALEYINPKEFEELFTLGKSQFPLAPLIWLKDLVAFLNSKIPKFDNDDPIFSKKPAGFPLINMPKSLRTTLETAINESGEQNSQLFYEFLLTAMVTDMSKNLPVTGYKIVIQIMAKHNPRMASANIAKLVSLRNSYQNRKPIGQSLLWALAQSAREDLGVAVKVWHEVMVPMLEAKNYSQYIAQLMVDFLDHHKSCSNLGSDLYLAVAEDLLSGKVSVQSTQIQKCTEIAEKMRDILFQNKSVNHRKLFESLILRLTPKINSNYRDEIGNALLRCLATDDSCFNSWRSLHLKNPYGSLTILKSIESNWGAAKPTFNIKQLNETLKSIEQSFDPTKKSKGKEDGFLSECYKLSLSMQKKMKQDEETRKRGFPWRACFYFLLFIVGAVLLVDYQRNGSIQRMRTSTLVRNNKIVEISQTAWSGVKQYTNRGLESVEKSYPEQYKYVSEQAQSYSKLAGEMMIIAKNGVVKVYSNTASYVAAKQPVVAATIEEYAPGLLGKMREHGSKGIALVTKYYAKLGEQVIEHSTSMIRWMELNVFVGKLSPESLQNYASQAINTTQTYASRTYDWVYDKVQTISGVH